jgi:hypothetical protein
LRKGVIVLLRTPLVTVLLVAGVAVATQAKTPPAATPSPGATGTPAATAVTTPTAATEAQETDPVVAAAQQAMRMHEQAAAACKEAIERSKPGGSLAQAQQRLLMAAALLYNSSADLKRVGQKEMTLAEKRTASGEQQERAAQSTETDEEKASIKRKAKANIAYGTAQSAIAESILAFSRRQGELAKAADLASKGTDGAALQKASKKIIEQSGAAKSLYQNVRETRAKLKRIAL